MPIMLLPKAPFCNCVLLFSNIFNYVEKKLICENRREVTRQSTPHSLEKNGVSFPHVRAGFPLFFVNFLKDI